MLNFLFPSKLLPIGWTVPDFALLDQQGRLVSLSGLTSAKGVVLLFFASDWLPGDLTLLQEFRDAHQALQQSGLQVVALSSLNWENLFYLAKRLDLPFPLLFDQCCRQATFYKAAWVKKFVSGRAIYILDNERRILFAQPKASPEQVLKSFEAYSLTTRL